ncbi:chaplin family protein, partial [Sphaerisporangium melleum]
AFSGCRGGASVKGGGGSGAGGNRTDGRHSVLGGNQVVAPITAPINVCGNAVAVLGDAAAGCLGGARVGGPGGRYGQSAHASGQVSGAKAQGAGLLSELPLVPALVGKTGTASSGPVALPPKAAPLPMLPAAPAQPAGMPLKGAAANGPLEQVTGTVAKTPVGQAVAGTPVGGVAEGRTVRDLPVNPGLMSAEQPLGLTGMNTGSLVALLAGVLLTAGATLFAGARRLRRR